MIKLERIRSKNTIPSAFRGKTPRSRVVSLMKTARKQLSEGNVIKLVIKSKWSSTKNQLLYETHNKCAYCESDITTVSFGDVEHYRPKSVYWWLAYVYDNYLVSCAICNQRFKGAKFEYSGSQLPAPKITAATSDKELKNLAKTIIPDPLDITAISAYEASHRSESPLIPNPYIDDPEPIFIWEIFEGSGEVEVVANPAFTGSENIVNACERIYGLNRPQLKRRRFERFMFYKTFRDALDDLPELAPSRSAVEKMILSLKKPNSEYTAMIRYLDKSGI